MLVVVGGGRVAVRVGMLQSRSRCGWRGVVVLQLRWQQAQTRTLWATCSGGGRRGRYSGQQAAPRPAAAWPNDPVCPAPPNEIP